MRRCTKSFRTRGIETTNKEKGYTLIEALVLVAIIIFLVLGIWTGLEINKAMKRADKIATHIEKTMDTSPEELVDSLAAMTNKANKLLARYRKRIDKVNIKDTIIFNTVQ